MPRKQALVVCAGNHQLPETTRSLSTDPVTFATKSRGLPPALSSTVVSNDGVTSKPQPTPANDRGQEPLPHAPFALFLPDSIPKPPRIAGHSLQELMLTVEGSSATLELDEGEQSSVCPDNHEMTYQLGCCSDYHPAATCTRRGDFST